MLALGGCASAGFGQATKIEPARVLDINTMPTSGSWGAGAVVGGAAGVLSGGGHSTESKLIRGAGGALIGAAIQKAFTTGNTRTSLILETRSGETLQVDHDANDLSPGDCVVLNTRTDGHVSVQRTSPTQCQF